jgi:hypothetical protein
LAQRAEILIADPTLFTPPTPSPFNQVEESSGVIEVTEIVESANAGSPYHIDVNFL